MASGAFGVSSSLEFDSFRKAERHSGGLVSSPSLGEFGFDEIVRAWLDAK